MATLEVITNTVVGAGGAASITFSTIPQTYQHLMVISSARSQRTGARWDGSTMRFNGESSGNNQSNVTLFNVGAAPTGTGETNGNRVSYLFDSPAADALADQFGASVVYFPNYRWGEFKKVIGWSASSNSSGAASDYGNTLATGSWRSTSAVTSIYIAPGVTGFEQYSTFTLYGINSA